MDCAIGNNRNNNNDAFAAFPSGKTLSVNEIKFQLCVHNAEGRIRAGYSKHKARL